MSQDALFDHMAKTHGLTLLESELNDIRHAVTRGEEAELQAARSEVDAGRKRIAQLENNVRAAEAERDGGDAVSVNLKQRIADLEAVLRLAETGCGNHGCKFKPPTGQGTNGPCACANTMRLALKGGVE